MARINWRERITIDPEIHHGDPCLRGTRIPAAMIVGSLADGMTFDEIMDAYPQLEIVDIYACLSYAADVMHQDVLVPMAL